MKIWEGGVASTWASSQTSPVVVHLQHLFEIILALFPDVFYL